MSLTVTPLYAGLLALLLVALSWRVIRARLEAKVSVGDGGDKGVIKAMRAQANCAEYAPMGVILLALAELQGAPGWTIHLLGSALLIGRLMHAYGFGRSPQIVSIRQLGMVLTFLMLIVAALANIAHAMI
ncbi:MAPEG family protein [Alisedimentitalea sp. MJ-SS2]|uniref:MAPEG family protein n=1 Tax=Aliisedimentitalea sp. MJ-SS2 TaxID=3049795 RepID=UPI002914DFC8|nr:MAPEG family protein [Alisedimentitalea sp. MJ-SS2]MDU8926301.1 MAPEG family protein [Alisedimentitalea sp. MJ-SS2]